MARGEQGHGHDHRHKERMSMSFAQQMAQTVPQKAPVDMGALAECIQDCFDCAPACAARADACLGEQDQNGLVRCIRLDLDCADLREATGKILSRQTAFEPAIARAALQACARACRRCGQACTQMLSAVAA